MHVCIAYKNGETKVLRIKRFSDLSTDKSDFYYYEEDLDAWGQGTCIKKADVLCIEIAPYPKADWPEDTTSKGEHCQSEPEVFDPRTMIKKPASANQMEAFLDNRPYR